MTTAKGSDMTTHDGICDWCEDAPATHDTTIHGEPARICDKTCGDSASHSKWPCAVCDKD